MEAAALGLMVTIDVGGTLTDPLVLEEADRRISPAFPCRDHRRD
jgi:hypothetical protein